LIYSFVFGNGLPLPTLGFTWRSKDEVGKRSFSVRLPFNLTFRKVISSKSSYSIFLRQNGGNQFIQTDRYGRVFADAGFPDPIQRLRFTQTQLGARLLLMPFKNSGVRLEGLFGLALRRSYKYSNSTISENNLVKNGPFFELKAFILISSQSKDETKELTEEDVIEYLDRDSDRLDF
jgi:hypothetical protein